MELAVVAGLGLIGSYIANNKDTETTDSIESNPINSQVNKKRHKANDTDQTKFSKKTTIIEANELDNTLTYNNGYFDSNKVRMFPSDIMVKCTMYMTQE